MSKFEEETIIEFDQPIYNPEPIIKPLELKIKYRYKDTTRIKKIEQGDWIDLYAAEDIEFKAGEYKLIPLGIAIELPSNYEANIVPRSSTFKNFKILQTNCFGVVDESYKGDGDWWFYPAYAIEDTVIHKNDKICQFRINKKQPDFEIIEVEYLGNNDRNGYGSTGVK